MCTSVFTRGTVLLAATRPASFPPEAAAPGAEGPPAASPLPPAAGPKALRSSDSRCLCCAAFASASFACGRPACGFPTERGDVRQQAARLVSFHQRGAFAAALRLTHALRKTAVRAGGTARQRRPRALRLSRRDFVVSFLRFRRKAVLPPASAIRRFFSSLRERVFKAKFACKEVSL